MPETLSTTTDDTERLHQPPRLRTIRFGCYRLTDIPDGHVGLRPRDSLPETIDEDWTANAEYLDANGTSSPGSVAYSYSAAAVPRSSTPEPGRSPCQKTLPTR
ncbi:hypothetical protein DFR70_110237 [Nocardia tenerifensis]|uniref:Uncharacterized protein n=1 Tax=Nocardia tenerifensis TaxID=228006 RepID=A0A318K0T4_9NOCA|nr:hypothetical protein [Nocardia tenerifensis]PXX60395.1 hypothetical protein DFR70_110237 [Nocardia tenerifensis]